MQHCICQAYRWQWGIIVILQHIPNAIWELITRYAKTFLLFRSKSWHISMAGFMKLLSMQKHFSFSVTKLQYPKIIMHNNLYLWGSVCEEVINPLLHGHWWGHWDFLPFNLQYCCPLRMMYPCQDVWDSWGWDMVCGWRSGTVRPFTQHLSLCCRFAMLALLSDYRHTVTLLWKRILKGRGEKVSVGIERGRPPEMGSACFSQWRLMDKVWHRDRAT